jgi:hypothetical protein
MDRLPDSRCQQPMFVVIPGPPALLRAEPGIGLMFGGFTKTDSGFGLRETAGTPE